MKKHDYLAILFAINLARGEEMLPYIDTGGVDHWTFCSHCCKTVKITVNKSLGESTWYGAHSCYYLLNLLEGFYENYWFKDSNSSCTYYIYLFVDILRSS